MTRRYPDHDTPAQLHARVASAAWAASFKSPTHQLAHSSAWNPAWGHPLILVSECVSQQESAGERGHHIYGFATYRQVGVCFSPLGGAKRIEKTRLHVSQSGEPRVRRAAG
jgi:hypothetical protein